MTPIRLFVADVDGTLVTPDKTLTARACAAVERMRKAGVGLAITSGRPPRGMAMLVHPLGLEHPLAAFNGGMFVQPDLTTVLEQRTLPPTVACKVVDHLLRARIDVWIYRGDEWFVRDLEAPHVARERETVKFAPAVVDELGSVLDGTVKIVGVSDEGDLVARCEAELRRRIGAQASVARSQPYYLDVRVKFSS